VGHAEAFNSFMDVVIAESVVFSIGAQLHHPKRCRGSGKEVDAIVRITAGADQRIHARSRTFRARALSMRSANDQNQKRDEHRPTRKVS
jgi:hypothetical protein